MKKSKSLVIVTALLMILVSMVKAVAIGEVVSYVATEYCQTPVSTTLPFTVAAIVFVAFALFQLTDRRIDRRHSLYAITQEFWVDYILENLFKDNSFMNYCYNESDYVLEGKVVHIPVAGSTPTVVKNRSSYPATAVQRTDTDITYNLDNYSTDPIHITEAEATEISYDKMSNVLSEHVAALGETIADDTLIKWAPSSATYMVRTTGASGTSLYGTVATGTRKKLLKEDIKSARTIMNKAKIAKNDRYCLLPTDLYNELLEDADLMKRDGVAGGEMDVKEGVIMKLYGFNIMERSDVLGYTNATPPVVKALGAAGAVTDNYGALCWQKDCVTKALGSTKFFENIGDALYQGDIYSALWKMGARQRRTAGVVAIVQTLLT